MANMYRDDAQAGRVGVASGSMRTCSTCGKPENPSKPHSHGDWISKALSKGGPRTSAYSASPKSPKANPTKDLSAFGAARNLRKIQRKGY